MNDKVERPYETLKNAVRATLMDANKEKQYWYYAYIDMIRKYNVTYHSALRDQEGYYFGVCNNNSLVEWFDPNTKAVKHFTTAKYNEFRTHVGNDSLIHGAFAIGGTSLKEKDLPLVELDTAGHLFFEEQPTLFTVPIHLKGQALGVKIAECDHYLLPFICRSNQGFPFHKHLPTSYRHNVWILSINSHEPTDSADAIDILQSLQIKGKTFNMNIYLIPKSTNPPRTLFVPMRLR
eukprot:7440558-Ditylum_brightwellii.AAC.1